MQENAVLKSEIEILRLKCKNLLEENRRLRQASVNIVSSNHLQGVDIINAPRQLIV
jgi:hypothetical protein